MQRKLPASLSNQGAQCLKWRRWWVKAYANFKKEHGLRQPQKILQHFGHRWHNSAQTLLPTLTLVCHQLTSLICTWREMRNKAIIGRTSTNYKFLFFLQVCIRSRYSQTDIIITTENFSRCNNFSIFGQKLRVLRLLPEEHRFVGSRHSATTISLARIWHRSAQVLGVDTPYGPFSLCRSGRQSYGTYSSCTKGIPPPRWTKKSLMHTDTLEGETLPHQLPPVDLINLAHSTILYALDQIAPHDVTELITSGVPLVSLGGKKIAIATKRNNIYSEITVSQPSKHRRPLPMDTARTVLTPMQS